MNKTTPIILFLLLAAAAFGQQAGQQQQLTAKIVLYYPDGKTDTLTFPAENNYPGDWRWMRDDGCLVYKPNAEDIVTFCGTYRITKHGAASKPK